MSKVEVIDINGNEITRAELAAKLNVSVDHPKLAPVWSAICDLRALDGKAQNGVTSEMKAQFKVISNRIGQAVADLTGGDVHEVRGGFKSEKPEKPELSAKEALGKAVDGKLGDKLSPDLKKAIKGLAEALGSDFDKAMEETKAEAPSFVIFREIGKELNTLTDITAKACAAIMSADAGKKEEVAHEALHLILDDLQGVAIRAIKKMKCMSVEGEDVTEEDNVKASDAVSCTKH